MRPGGSSSQRRVSQLCLIGATNRRGHCSPLQRSPNDAPCYPAVPSGHPSVTGHTIPLAHHADDQNSLPGSGLWGSSSSAQAAHEFGDLSSVPAGGVTDGFVLELPRGSLRGRIDAPTAVSCWPSLLLLAFRNEKRMGRWTPRQDSAEHPAASCFTPALPAPSQPSPAPATGTCRRKTAATDFICYIKSQYRGKRSHQLGFCQLMGSLYTASKGKLELQLHSK
ncbi:uncharacterized protein LOC128853914 [Cuculus canorus]|uniref:uncharacterized protein LOC128853914 n=1 Tax=Cuculus canorus TaxID=55661 RepID=UPI0023AAC6D1|nr:uncharacterized protein LOC128853914 [Cuculus canorus]